MQTGLQRLQTQRTRSPLAFQPDQPFAAGTSSAPKQNPQQPQERRTRAMRSNLVRNLTAVFATAVLGCSAHSALGGDHCFYKGTMFSDGAAACQSGLQYRCDDGEWRSAGLACPAGPLVASRTCEFGGISFSTGAASCQAGSQFRCEDGTWRSLALPCSVGDSPIRIVPSGRTCMYEGATVASNSTICRSGNTFFCSDGEWMNLGTLCR